MQWIIFIAIIGIGLGLIQEYEKKQRKIKELEDEIDELKNK